MSYQIPSTFSAPVNNLTMVVGSATPSQGQKVQILSTAVPAGAIGAVIKTHSSSGPQAPETLWLIAHGSAYLDLATDQLQYTYFVYEGRNAYGSHGEGVETLTPGGNGTLIESALVHRVRIENYGSTLQIYSEDLSSEVETASVSISVEFIGS